MAVNSQRLSDVQIDNLVLPPIPFLVQQTEHDAGPVGRPGGSGDFDVGVGVGGDQRDFAGSDVAEKQSRLMRDQILVGFADGGDGLIDGFG